MIHRYIYDVLTTGIAAYLADTQLVDDLFDELYSLESTETEAIKTYFLAHGLNVVQGYARQDSEFPLVAIVLHHEGEAENFIGDYAGQVDEEGDTLYGAEIESAIWDHIFHLDVYTEHPDVTSYMYEMIKSIMLAGLKVFTELGCAQYRFSGMDLAPDPNYIPAYLFARRMVFSCWRQFYRVDRDSRLLKAFQVSGIHIDKSGSSSDVGGVETNVVPYAVGDEDDET